ncbi:MAG: hypothetical protein ACR2HN_06830 [Tepidiformaceae bacterium]
MCKRHWLFALAVMLALVPAGLFARGSVAQGPSGLGAPMSGAAFDAAGEDSLAVSMAGEGASARPLSFAGGRVTVSATISPAAEAAGRTWRFEVVDARGAVVETLSLGTSADAPAGTAQGAPLAPGFYTVRQVLGKDTALACAEGVFYEVTSPAGALERVDLGPGGVRVAFSISLCQGSGGLEGNRPIDTLAPASTGLDGAGGARVRGAPLPPATGSGTAQIATAARYEWALLVALIAGHVALGAAALRRKPSMYSHLG